MINLVKGIKEKDIRDFVKYANKLNDVIVRIREYYKGDGNPTIYVTPGEMNLMWRLVDNMDYVEYNEASVASVPITYFECGDW